MSDEVGPSAGGAKPLPPSLRATRYLVVGSLVWSVVVIAIGAALSKPYVLSTNASGTVVASGGTSALVGIGVLSLGVSILVAQITARRVNSRLLPIAWVISAGSALVALVSIVKVGPVIIPSAAACLAACYLARQRALIEE